MNKLDINPKAMTLPQAVHLFESLDTKGRQEFYKMLDDHERDALYYGATDSLIKSVHLTTKNRVDAKADTDRNKRRGYILPDTVHRAENDCLWRSSAWKILLGQVCESWLAQLPHLHPHFEALGHNR